MGTAKRERQKQNRAERRQVDARQYRSALIKRRVLKWGGITVLIVGGVFILAQVTREDSKSVESTTTVADGSSTTVADGSTSTVAEVPTATTAPGASVT